MNNSRSIKTKASKHIKRDISVFLKLDDDNYKIITEAANILISVQYGKTICPAYLSRFRIMRAMNHCTAGTLDLVAGILEQDWMDWMVKTLQIKGRLMCDE